MTTTGTNNFTITRDELIKATLRLLGVIGIGETPVAEDYTNCTQALNIMLKSWAKKGLPLWVVSYMRIPCVQGVGTYNLGLTVGASVGRVDVSGGTGYAASGTWTATGGTTGVSASGTFTSTGGVLDSPLTIVNGGTLYTAAPTIAFSGGGAGATVTPRLAGLTTSRPLRIIEAFLRDSNNNDVNLVPASRQEYDLLGQKSSQGIPNQYYYDNQLPDGNLYLYNVPVDSTHTIYATVQRMFYDMTNSTDTFDFPQEFFQALKWGLAAEVSMEYGVNLHTVDFYEGKAEYFINEAFDYSVEEASVFFSPDPRGLMRGANEPTR